MERSMLGLAVFLLAGAGCISAVDSPVEALPHALVTGSGAVIRIGEPVPGATPGGVAEYADLHLPDGATRAWVEVDGHGDAGSFELWYAPEKAYEDVVRYHETQLGPPTSRFERLAGACVVWEDSAVRFEVCRSREPEEHGVIIAHVWPRRP